jgi:hypothetical protein
MIGTPTPRIQGVFNLNQFYTMEEKTIQKETLERIKTLPRIDYLAYLELINQGQVKRLQKLKKPRTIFFEEESGCFLYFNSYYQDFSKCGIFKDVIND